MRTSNNCTLKQSVPGYLQDDAGYEQAMILQNT